MSLTIDDLARGDFYTIHAKKVVFRKPILGLDGAPEYATVTWHEFNGRYLKATGVPLSLKFEVSRRFLAIVFPADILVVSRMNPALRPEARRRNGKGKLWMP